jgi:hypothetical protein
VPESTLLTDIPQAERWVQVQNATPGLTSLAVEVNGKVFMVAGLGSGMTRTIDVGSAMKPGSGNRVRLETRGKPGGSAWVLIHD